jgi:hypothetical protein
MSQKIVQYQAVLQLSQTAPNIYDMQYLHRQMIETLGVKNADKIIPPPEDAKPKDPVTENMDILNGKPAKAFIYQDHEAHLMVHNSAMQDPKLRQMIGQNPKAQEIMGAAMAHIMEHIAFQYRKEIEEQLGAALPPTQENGEDTKLPEAVEVQISRLSAQAAAKLLQKDQQEVQQQQAQQQAQDPVLQMQQQELQLRQQELQLKAQQIQMEAQVKQAELQLDAQLKQAELQRKQQEMQIMAATKADELDLRKQEIANRSQIDAARLGVDVQKHKAGLTAKQQSEGMRMGIDIAKSKDAAIRAAMRPPKGSKKEE